MANARFNPIKQGDLDGLCGIYAIINVFNYVAPNGLNETERAHLFHYLIYDCFDRTNAAERRRQERETKEDEECCPDNAYSFFRRTIQRRITPEFEEYLLDRAARLVNEMRSNRSMYCFVEDVTNDKPVEMIQVDSARYSKEDLYKTAYVIGIEDHFDYWTEGRFCHWTVCTGVTDIEKDSKIEQNLLLVDSGGLKRLNVGKTRLPSGECAVPISTPIKHAFRVSASRGPWSRSPSSLLYVPAQSAFR